MINIVTFGKPDGYKDLHIGHLSSTILFSDLYYRHIKNTSFQSKTYLVSGTDGYGMATYIECWKSLNRMPNKEELRDYVNRFYLKQLKTLNKFHVFPDCFASDVDEQTANGLQDYCNMILKEIVAAGLCYVKEEPEYSDPVYHVGLGKRNYYYDPTKNTYISRLSNKPAVKTTRKNWFLSLEKARNIIVKETENVIDKDILKYIKNMLCKDLPDYRLTSYQPWALQVSDELSGGKGMSFQVWYESLLAPAYYTKRLLMNQRICFSDDEIRFVHFMAEDNMFFYVLVRSVLWHFLPYNNNRLVLIKFRKFLDEHNQKCILSAEQLLQKYDANTIRLFFLMRGVAPTTFRFNNEDFGRALKKYNKIVSTSKKSKDQSIKHCDINGKYEYVQLLKSYDEYILNFEYQKAADLIDFVLSNKSKEDYYGSFLKTVVGEYIPNVIDEEQYENNSLLWN